MSIFGKIASAIFGIHTASAAEASATEAPMASNMPVVGGPVVTATAVPGAAAVSAGASMATPSPRAAPQISMTGVDVGKVLDGLKAKQKEALDWRKSIVDLMKLLALDSSLSARRELAKELQYDGDMGDSASMNVWLHKQVMTKLAENGGIVPNDLKH